MNNFKLTPDQKFWLHIIAIMFNITLLFMPLYKIHNSGLYGAIEKSYKMIVVILIVYLVTFILIKLSGIFRKPLNSFVNFCGDVTVVPSITIFLFPFYFFSLILALILTGTITSNKEGILYYSDIILKYILVILFFIIIYFCLALLTKIILKIIKK